MSILIIYVLVYGVIIGAIVLSFVISNRNIKKNMKSMQNQLSGSVKSKNTEIHLLEALQEDFKIVNR